MPSQYAALNDASRLAHADLTGDSPNPEDHPEAQQKRKKRRKRTIFRFEVPGDPRGYTTTTHRDKGRSARYKKYREYCQLVREYAAMAGVEIPLRASRDEPLFIKIIAYFRNGVHADVENVRKGCVDAMFYDPLSKTKGDDKWVAGSFPLPRYDEEEPRLMVIIKEYEPE